MDPIFHITSRRELAAAGATGEYRPQEFDADGFVHCSTRVQVLRTANRFYAGIDDLVLLEIDPERLRAELRFESLEGGDELFPHLYGPLPLASVARTHAFPCDAEGTFTFPSAAGGC